MPGVGETMTPPARGADAQVPVAVVLGLVYGVWWTLAVPVAVTVAMAYVEHLRTPRAGLPDIDN